MHEKSKSITLFPCACKYTNSHFLSLYDCMIQLLLNNAGNNNNTMTMTLCYKQMISIGIPYRHILAALSNKHLCILCTVVGSCIHTKINRVSDWTRRKGEKSWRKWTIESGKSAGFYSLLANLNWWWKRW